MVKKLVDRVEHVKAKFATIDTEAQIFFVIKNIKPITQNLLCLNLLLN